MSHDIQVQDFTQAELFLVLSLARDPDQCFLAGDTAQVCADTPGRGAREAFPCAPALAGGRQALAGGQQWQRAGVAGSAGCCYATPGSAAALARARARERERESVLGPTVHGGLWLLQAS